MFACIGGLFFFILLVLYLKSNSNNYLNRIQYKRLYIIFVLFGVFGVSFGDFWSYASLVEEAYKAYQSYQGDDWHRSLHMEPLYNNLAVFCGGNYFLWRFVWYIVQYFGIFYMFKCLKIDNYRMIYLFSIFALFSVSGGRVSWGISFFWLGFYTFYKTKNKKVLLYFFAALFSHNSIILLFLILPFIFVRVKKTYALITLFLIPSLAFLVSDLINTLLDQLELLGSAYDADKLAGHIYFYQNSQDLSFWGRSIGEIIVNLLSRFPLYYVFLVYLYNYHKKNILLSDAGEKLLRISYTLFLFTLVVLFAKLGSVSFYERYLIMLFLPVFLLTCVESGNFFLKRKDFKFCIFLMFTSDVFAYLKSIYYYSIQEPSF